MNKYRTGNYNFLRQQNLIGLMNHLYDNAPISRVELSRLTELNKTTVSSLIEELLENGFVLETGIGKRSGAGRSSVLLDLNPNHGYMVSGEIGGNFVHVICTDFSGEILWQHKKNLNKTNWEDVCEHFISVLREAVDFTESRGNLLGLALGVHGLLDKETGNLLLVPSSGWRDVPLLSILRQNFTTDIFLDNEANFAAIGEQFFGSAKGFNEVLYISAGRGLGGGFVLNGQVYKGTSGIAGEFGHMTVNPEGLLCDCGNYGCWETEVNLKALRRHINKNKDSATDKPIKELSIETIIRDAQNNDPATLDALGKVGQQFGIGLASLINIFNPGLIVFGGELSLASEYLLPAARIELEKRSLKWGLQQTRIVNARFGSEAAIMGGIATIFQSVLSNLTGLKRNT